MEPEISDEGYKILQDPLKSRALLLDYYRRMGRKVYSGWTGKEIDVDALLAKAFPESKKYNK
jgi:hypothetical protein